MGVQAQGRKGRSGTVIKGIRPVTRLYLTGWVVPTSPMGRMPGRAQCQQNANVSGALDNATDRPSKNRRSDRERPPRRLRRLVLDVRPRFHRLVSGLLSWCCRAPCPCRRRCMWTWGLGSAILGLDCNHHVHPNHRYEPDLLFHGVQIATSRGCLPVERRIGPHDIVRGCSIRSHSEGQETEAPWEWLSCRAAGQEWLTVSPSGVNRLSLLTNRLTWPGGRHRLRQNPGHKHQSPPLGRGDPHHAAMHRMLSMMEGKCRIATTMNSRATILKFVIRCGWTVALVLDTRRGGVT
jgi:hypothetical protein